MEEFEYFKLKRFKWAREDDIRLQDFKNNLSIKDMLTRLFKRLLFSFGIFFYC